MPAAAVIRVVQVLIFVTWRKGCVDGKKIFSLTERKFLELFSRVIKVIMEFLALGLKND